MSWKLPPADLKGRLAAKGQTLRSDADVNYVRRPITPADQVIVLERVEDREPEYCNHGYAECVYCHELCWLGHETSKLVTSGQAQPLCQLCAAELIPPESRQPVRRVVDHRRAGGPHE